MRRIRSAIDALIRELGLEHVLASRLLHTDGAKVLHDYARHAVDSRLAVYGLEWRHLQRHRRLLVRAERECNRRRKLRAVLRSDRDANWLRLRHGDIQRGSDQLRRIWRKQHGNVFRYLSEWNCGNADGKCDRYIDIPGLGRRVRGLGNEPYM